jgi:Rod binding domain-containing protein
MDASIISTIQSATPPKRSLAGGNTPGASATNTAALKAAEEFEAVFMTTLLEGMFKGVKTDGPFGGGHSEQMYRSLMLGEYAKDIAASGGLGIADHVYREILAVQEMSQQ